MYDMRTKVGIVLEGIFLGFSVVSNEKLKKSVNKQ